MVARDLGLVLRSDVGLDEREERLAGTADDRRGSAWHAASGTEVDPVFSCWSMAALAGHAPVGSLRVEVRGTRISRDGGCLTLHQPSGARFVYDPAEDAVSEVTELPDLRIRTRVYVRGEVVREIVRLPEAETG